MTPLVSTASDGAHVYVGRAARTKLAKLEPNRRAGMTAAFLRVGQELLERGVWIAVPLSWVRRTSSARHYPQQCYVKTLKYVQDHPHITGMRLVHGVTSHAPRFITPGWSCRVASSSTASCRYFSLTTATPR